MFVFRENTMYWFVLREKCCIKNRKKRNQTKLWSLQNRKQVYCSNKERFCGQQRSFRLSASSDWRSLNALTVKNGQTTDTWVRDVLDVKLQAAKHITFTGLPWIVADPVVRTRYYLSWRRDTNSYVLSSTSNWAFFVARDDVSFLLII
jgi:hypothetical protein